VSVFLHLGLELSDFPLVLVAFLVCEGLLFVLEALFLVLDGLRTAGERVDIEELAADE
jgi:hypothetical protein